MDPRDPRGGGRKGRREGREGRFPHGIRAAALLRELRNDQSARRILSPSAAIFGPVGVWTTLLGRIFDFERARLSSGRGSGQTLKAWAMHDKWLRDAQLRV